MTPSPIHYLTYRDRRSMDFGVYISGAGTFNAPERDVEKFEVPGRSGDLIIDNGKFKNVELTYNAFIVRNFRQNMEALRGFLLSSYGYYRLEDTYHPDQYRMAAFSGPIEPETFLVKSGTFELTFDCMPQRWLKSGDIAAQVNAGETVKIWNPTHFDAKPLIAVTGTGTFSINGATVTVQANNGGLIIDCEREECYEGTINRNSKVLFSASKFPEFRPGENSIQAGSGIYLQITPRWWTV